MMFNQTNMALIAKCSLKMNQGPI